MGHPDGWWQHAHVSRFGSGPIYRQPWVLGGLGAVAVLLVAVILTEPGSDRSKVSAGASTTVPSTVTTLNLAPVAGANTTLPLTTMPPATTLPPPTSATTVVFPSPTTTPSIVTVPPPTAPPTTPSTVPPPSTAPASLCGAPPNPMGYNFCGRGTLIYHPDPRTCAYFSCIANLRSGSGYLVECRDGQYSLTGGHTSACSAHGGVLRTVFSGT